MREVAVIGTGMIRFDRYPEKTLATLALPAVLSAIREAGVERDDIEAAYCGTALGGMMAGQRILKQIGLVGIPVHNLENACASSATAFREAWIGVASGVYDVAIAMGAEKLTRYLGGPLPMEGEDFEGAYGLAPTGLYAMRAQRYLHDYNLSEAQLAGVSVKAHKHAVKNPDAQRNREVSLEEVMRSKPVADPFTLLHCCPVGDGASAVVICAAELAHKYVSGPVVKVQSSTLTSGVLMTGFRDMTKPEVSYRASKQAYEAAGLGPEDIDLAEVHDAFTIAELLYYEALGFCPPGEAVRLLEDGDTSVGGRIPVNPSGGLLGKGHPVGATGVAQIVEVVRQLQGRCGARQVEGAKVGLTHVTGGGVSGLDHGACAIHIFTR